MGVNEWSAMLTGVAAVLGTIGGTLRYLVRMAQALERTSVQAATMSQAFGRHIDASETFHAALTERVTEHGEQIAALSARVDGMGRRP